MSFDRTVIVSSYFSLVTILITRCLALQLWKNKEKKGELIAGDQGWLVMEKIREMLSDKEK